MNLKNFLSVLSGDEKEASGKVIKSGPEDDIFLYFVDHGAYGIVSLPADYLDAQTLKETLVTMHEKRQFRRMLIYLEACYSGSMFQDYLPQDIGVMAVTASNSTQPSYACFYNETLDTFLADVFSYSWTTNSEQRNHKTESILDQILYVTNTTADYSQTSVFGKLDIEKMNIAQFQGSYEPKDSLMLEHEYPLISNATSVLQERFVSKFDFQSTNLFYFRISMRLGKSMAMVENECKVDLVMERILKASKDLKSTKDSFDDQCYFKTIKIFHKLCFNLGENSYALHKVEIFKGLCSKNINYERLHNHIAEICSEKLH